MQVVSIDNTRQTSSLQRNFPNYIIMIFCRIVTKYNSFIIIMARTKFISANILNPNAEISSDILSEENLGN